MTDGLFSWLNELFSWLFSLGMNGKLNWIERHWITFVLIIAIFVALMDLLVWFMRYKPYRDWIRVYNKVFKRGAAETRPKAMPERRPRAPVRAPETPPARSARRASPPAKTAPSVKAVPPNPAAKAEPLVLAPPTPRVRKEPETQPLTIPLLDAPPEHSRIAVSEKPRGIETKASEVFDDDVPTIR